MGHNCRKLEFQTNNNKWRVCICVYVRLFVYVYVYLAVEYVTHTQRSTHGAHGAYEWRSLSFHALFNFLLMSCLSFVAASADAAFVLIAVVVVVSAAVIVAGVTSNCCCCCCCCYFNWFARRHYNCCLRQHFQLKQPKVIQLKLKAFSSKIFHSCLLRIKF